MRIVEGFLGFWRSNKKIRVSNRILGDFIEREKERVKVKEKIGQRN